MALKLIKAFLRGLRESVEYTLATIVKFVGSLRVVLFGYPKNHCRHYWHPTKDGRINVVDERGKIIAYNQVMRCETCGTLKSAYIGGRS